MKDNSMFGDSTSATPDRILRAQARTCTCEPGRGAGTHVKPLKPASGKYVSMRVCRSLLG